MQEQEKRRANANGESSKTDSARKVSDKPPVITRPLLPRQTAITTPTAASPRTASSALSSGTSTAPRKTSFAELVRNFKAAKRAKTAAPVHQENVELDPLDAILDEDFSDILSPGPGSSSTNRTNETDASTEPGPSKRIVAGKVKQTKASTFVRTDQFSDSGPAVPTATGSNPRSEKNEDSFTSEKIANDRHNTPVTKMYAKFDSLSEHQENSESTSTSETLPTFTPYINTQSVGLMSSAKENLAPPPHFNLSPIVVEPIGCHGDVISSVDDVTKEELSAKTSRPQEASLFHDRTAEKLKRFSYQSKGK